MTTGNIHLASGDISSLWSSYMGESLSKQVLGFMLQHIQDTDVKPIVQSSYDMACNQLDQLQTIFDNENYASPHGFTSQDVYMEAPWLFMDIFSLTYVNQMMKVAMVTYSGTVTMSDRTDIRNHFIQALNGVTTIYNQSRETILTKGLGGRYPYIEVPKKSEYVDSKEYFSGLKPFSDKRPLNSVEITNLYMNILTNLLGQKLSMAFAQTSPTKEVQEFMLRAKDISKKHIQIFSDTLLEDEIDTPQEPDIGISESTTQTFSDKLMMFHMSLISASGIGNYATSSASSQRSDLMVNYERLSLEASRLAKSGADIMVKNNWMEQPPGIKDREKLAKNKQ